MTDYSERTLPARRQMSILEVDEVIGMKAQLAALNHEMTMLRAKRKAKPVMICGLCDGEHFIDQCPMAPRDVNFVQNRQPGGQEWNNQQNRNTWQGQKWNENQENSG